MQKRNEAAFDNWWACLRPDEREGLDRAVCRRAFFAGFTTGVKPENKRFVFSAGKRRVTVLAPSYGAAKRKADVILTKRVEAEGRSPPASEWRLQPAVAREATS
ncbi:hypothetical protein EDF70_1011333 [Neorhizobium sp. JUb45]|nr:hypothetical protein EDF70_1011333 [Neorhizobium sp. JUb45]